MTAFCVPRRAANKRQAERSSLTQHQRGVRALRNSSNPRGSGQPEPVMSHYETASCQAPPLTAPGTSTLTGCCFVAAPGVAA